MSIDSEHQRVVSYRSFRPSPQPSRPPSIASVLSTATTLKPEFPKSYGRPPVLGTEPTIAPGQSYRGFASEREYLLALRRWVEEREYVQFDYSLIGFYGTKTAEDYTRNPNLRYNKAKVKPEGESKSASVTQGGSQADAGSTPSTRASQAGQEEPETTRSRTKSFGNLFGRKGPVQ
jgi:hypothetical protein